MADELQEELRHGNVSGIDVFESVIEGEQVELIYRQGRSAIITGLMLAVMVSIGLWNVLTHSQIMLWLGTHVALTMARLLLIRQFYRTPAQSRHSAEWVLLFFVSTLLSGVAWGCLGLFYNMSWPVEYQMMVLMSLAGILSGAISSYAAMLSVYVAFMVPAILIPAQSMLLNSNTMQKNLGLIILLFAGALLVLARNSNRNIMESLQLRQQNGQLLDEMIEVNDTLEKEIASRVASQRAQLIEQKLFTAGPVTVFRWLAREGWPIEYVSETIAQFGYDAKTLIDSGRCYSDLIWPSDMERVQDAQAVIRADGSMCFDIDYRIMTPDGDVRWIYDYTIPVSDECGKTTHYYGYILDITERKSIEFELQRQTDRGQVTLRSIADAVITTDVNGQVEYMNPRAESLTGWECELARGMPLSRVLKLTDTTTQVVVDDPVSQCLRSGCVIESMHDYRLSGTGSGRHDVPAYVRFSASPIRSETHSMMGVVLVFYDVTSARTLERALSYQSTHDALTGLLNRTQFEARINAAMEACREDYSSHVLCHLDVDQLKVVNETCSHEAGDDLLRRVAALLLESFHDCAEIARLGGDEFGILITDTPMANAARMVAQVIDEINAVRFSSCGRVFEVSASVGLSQISADSSGATQVMSEADLACQAAKDLGGNRQYVFHAGNAELARRHDEMLWVSKIVEALESDSLVLYCQPIVPLAPGTDAGIHLEILLRMLDERGSLIMPDCFLSAAERYGLIVRLDRWVVSRSLEWYAEQLPAMAAAAPLTLSINLSGVSITDPSMVRHIRHELQDKGIPASAICIEITETAAISNLQAAAAFMQELRALGCRFSLDDFGSGLSSFAYLKNLPVDYLKIDGEFIRNMDSDEVNYAMVSAVQQLGSVIGIRTIAEFVENEPVMKLLAGLGVDYVQGFAIARPLPLESIDIKRDDWSQLRQVNESE